MPLSDEPVIVLDGVSRTFGSGDNRVDAVVDLSHAFLRGCFHAVLGPSGSGKSTLLHLMSGLDRPTAGSVHVAGRNIAELDDAELARLRRREIGFVFQFFNLVPSLTVEENALLPVYLDRRATRNDRERLELLLERLGIAARRSHHPDQLSGGERQRAAIARAMLPAPSILLADEPTGSLDSQNGARVTQVLEDLAHHDGVCVVAVTHDADVAARADHVLHLHDGRVESLESGA